MTDLYDDFENRVFALDDLAGTMAFLDEGRRLPDSDPIKPLYTEFERLVYEYLAWRACEIARNPHPDLCQCQTSEMWRTLKLWISRVNGHGANTAAYRLAEILQQPRVIRQAISRVLTSGAADLVSPPAEESAGHFSWPSIREAAEKAVAAAVSQFDPEKTTAAHATGITALAATAARHALNEVTDAAIPDPEGMDRARAAAAEATDDPRQQAKLVRKWFRVAMEIVTGEDEAIMKAAKKLDRKRKWDPPAVRRILARGPEREKAERAKQAEAEEHRNESVRKRLEKQGKRPEEIEAAIQSAAEAEKKLKG